MVQSDFPSGVRKRAFWCHLAGIGWFAVYVIQNVMTFALFGLLAPLGGDALPGLQSIVMSLSVVFSLLAFPFLSGFVVALIVWKMNRAFHPFVDDCGKAATNFQATMGLYSFCMFLVFAFLILVTCGPVFFGGSWYGGGQSSPEAALAMVGLGLIGLAGLLALAWSIFQVAVVILAAVKASNGQMYRYPLSRQFFP